MVYGGSLRPLLAGINPRSSCLDHHRTWGATPCSSTIYPGPSHVKYFLRNSLTISTSAGLCGAVRGCAGLLPVDALLKGASVSNTAPSWVIAGNLDGCTCGGYPNYPGLPDSWQSPAILAVPRMFPRGPWRGVGPTTGRRHVLVWTGFFLRMPPGVRGVWGEISTLGAGVNPLVGARNVAPQPCVRETV